MYQNTEYFLYETRVTWKRQQIQLPKLHFLFCPRAPWSCSRFRVRWRLIRIMIFWVMLPCSLVGRRQCFRRGYKLRVCSPNVTLSLAFFSHYCLCWQALYLKMQQTFEVVPHESWSIFTLLGYTFHTICRPCYFLNPHTYATWRWNNFAIPKWRYFETGIPFNIASTNIW